ncbi:1,4-dihydroxy-2-naphthoate polyprenyltransferase [Gryllotalpicola sp.]|uniref:1,4-dihydroxy-2-naphthoate polyprenyltransferase n=1 Tax=Gryllotalpicola sp. TaxID=1932787 RepID=UPI00262BE2E3|nr:1,4-dihydroxy-2-naphthoate polyprenyltransferase [Gryllotalpicola sp.]
MSTRAKKPSRRPGNPARSRRPGAVAPARFGDWVAAARLRTLPLAIAPVFIGTGAASTVTGAHSVHWALGLACLGVALALQIGVNYANDYSDGIRGTDAYRVGPGRLTASDRARPRTVLAVALAFFAVAAIAGVVVIVRTQLWWLLAVGAAAIVAAWFYTGGKRPYGYHGLGEVFVFAFFGLAAVAGTEYVEVGSVTLEGWWGAVAAGFLACAVLVVNNLRDIETDRAAGKRTLSVLIGSTASKALYTVLTLLPFAMLVLVALFYTLGWLGLLVLFIALPAVIIAWTARTPRELVIALQLSGLVALLYGIALWAAYTWS